MKNLSSTLCFILAVLFLLSCHNKNAASGSDSTKVSLKPVVPPDNQSWEITLNGIYANTADTMKKHFCKYRRQDSKPLTQSVWFDSATIHHLVRLLYKERGKESPTGDLLNQTDGVRIYFVSDISVCKGHLKNSVVLVSTKND